MSALSSPHAPVPGVEPRAQLFHLLAGKRGEAFFELILKFHSEPPKGHAHMLTIHPSLNSMKIMYEHVNTRNGKWSPLLADDVYEIIKAVRIHAPTPIS